MGVAGSLGVGERGVSIIEAMVIDMNEAQVRTLEQVRQVVVSPPDEYSLFPPVEYSPV